MDPADVWNMSSPTLTIFLSKSSGHAVLRTSSRIILHLLSIYWPWSDILSFTAPAQIGRLPPCDRLIYPGTKEVIPTLGEFGFSASLRHPRSTRSEAVTRACSMPERDVMFPVRNSASSVMDPSRALGEFHHFATASDPLRMVFAWSEFREVRAVSSCNRTAPPSRTA